MLVHAALQGTRARRRKPRGRELAGRRRMWPAPRGDRLHLWRVAEVAASLQAAVERSYGPRYADEDDDDARLDRKGWSGADALESTRSAHPRPP